MESVTRVGRCEGRLHSGVVTCTVGRFRRHNMGTIGVSRVSHKLHISGHAICRVFNSGRRLLLTNVGVRQTRCGTHMRRCTLARTHGMVSIVKCVCHLRVRHGRRINVIFCRRVREVPHVLRFLGRRRSGRCSSDVHFFRTNMSRNCFQGSIGFRIIFRSSGVYVSRVVRRRLCGEFAVRRLFSGCALVVVQKFYASHNLRLLSGTVKRLWDLCVRFVDLLVVPVLRLGRQCFTANLPPGLQVGSLCKFHFRNGPASVGYEYLGPL